MPTVVIIMPVLDSDNIDILKEKVDAWRAVEKENLANYCEILNHLTFLADEVNGHPSTSVRMLGEIKSILIDLPQAIAYAIGRPAEDRSPRWLSPWWLVLIVGGTAITSTLLTMLIVGAVHLPFP